MITIEQLRAIVLAFPETTESAHFHKVSFRVKKKIFATYNGKNNTANLKLSEIDQDVFSAFDRTIIYPVANKWGQQGWTTVELNSVGEDLLADALTSAYCEVAPKKLAEQVDLDKSEE